MTTEEQSTTDTEARNNVAAYYGLLLKLIDWILPEKKSFRKSTLLPGREQIKMSRTLNLSKPRVIKRGNQVVAIIISKAQYKNLQKPQSRTRKFLMQTKSNPQYLNLIWI